MTKLTRYIRKRVKADWETIDAIMRNRERLFALAQIIDDGDVIATLRTFNYLLTNQYADDLYAGGPTLQRLYNYLCSVTTTSIPYPKFVASLRTLFTTLLDYRRTRQSLHPFSYRLESITVRLEQRNHDSTSKYDMGKRRYIQITTDNSERMILPATVKFVSNYIIKHYRKLLVTHDLEVTITTGRIMVTKKSIHK